MTVLVNEKLDTLFDLWNKNGEMISYGELLIEPGLSRGYLEDISLDSFFSPNVPLRVPLVSAAMDTVTESETAIAMAVSGGLGVIHRNLTPQQQVEEVDRVKHFMSARIAKPICVYDTVTIADVIRLRERKRYNFHSFLVINRRGELVGLITRRHLEGQKELRQQVGKVMIPFKQLVTASPETTKEQAYKLLRRYDRSARQVTLIPLIDSHRRPRALYTRKDLEYIFEGKSMHNVDKTTGRLRVAAAIGVGRKEYKRALMLADKVDALVIDTAHAHTEEAAKMIRWVRHHVECDLVPGNISTPAAAEYLKAAGAHAVKIGQGPGTICTTRDVSGMGITQGTAVYNCARHLRGSGIYSCADGGIRKTGDIAKSLALGADSVMMGRLFAGTKEAPGETFTYEGRLYKPYRGMGSPMAMQERRGSRDRYRQGKVPVNKTVAEGIDAAVPYIGELRNAFESYESALRIALGYAGVQSIPELQQKVRINRMSAAGMAESGVHDVLPMAEISTTQRRPT